MNKKYCINNLMTKIKWDILKNIKTKLILTLKYKN